jgi:ABC-type antimicrobial peptide transport system permease subunit
MGVRIALGALPADVVRLVVRDGLILAGAGVGAGLVASLALAPVLRSMLYAITPRDPATLVAVAITVGVVALLASWIPARRASRLDPVQALRSD